MKLLLLTSPMIQINTPYPATAYLKGFLDSQFTNGEIETVQADPAIELIDKLFSRAGLQRLKKNLPKKNKLGFFLEFFREYESSVEDAVAYLRGANKNLEKKILTRNFLPEGYRFRGLHEEGPLLVQFMALAPADQAQHLASLYLDDVADYYTFGADARFAFARYGEKLAASQASFDALEKNLRARPTLVDEMLEEVTIALLKKHKPNIVGLSIPFSGTVYAALRMGKILKKGGLPVLLGGGYANTELRKLGDSRIFQYVDFITLDDGERPLLCLLEHLSGKREKKNLLRTYYCEEGRVIYSCGASEKDIPFRETGTPSYAGLPIKKYIPMYEMLNPVTRLWSGYFWNKLTLAHGCYWHRCSFCDTSLDYIGRYETQKASELADKMEKIAGQTGCDGFHFVDEAAPPAILRALSEELIRRKSKFSWWGNIRFDKAFTPGLCMLMKKAGCIAVTGGLEVASPRLLKLIDKGVTIEQVARVTKAFQDSGIFVHAYLMYGFPSQTTQETVDSLEVVRQLFVNGCLQSAFWHRFAATVHSPIGKNPEHYGIKLCPPPTPAQGLFAENDLPFLDPVSTDHDALGLGLNKALYNFMHGVGLDIEVQEWFSAPVPKSQIPATLVANSL